MRKTLATTAGVIAVVAGGSVAGLAVASGDDATGEASTQNTVLVQNGAQNPDDGMRHGPRGDALQAASEIVGVETDDLRDMLRDGQTLAEIAAANGVSEDALVSQLADRANEQLDQAVEDGFLTQEQADEKRASLTERIQERVTSDSPPQRGERGPGGGASLETAARVIGESETSIRADLRSGQTLAQIAGDAGVETSTVVDAIVADKTERIEQRIEDGVLTQERADEKLANLDERVEARVNGERPSR
ncbi:MAG: hypothetical protein ACR2N6_05820 [Miltoncostaeaceae bacterium]